MPATARGDTIPFELKLDMARQAWDEARHVEISAKLCDWMGTELGEFQENTVLFEAACSNDPVLRLAGVNRALEGLAIDVFTQMKEFGDLAGDPFLEFCEDWMLADEVTHVKMGSDWLRKVTEKDPDRRSQGARVPAGRRQAVQLRRRPRRLTTRVRSSSPDGSASWPGSPTTRSTRSPARSARRSTSARQRSSGARRGGVGADA